MMKTLSTALLFTLALAACSSRSKKTDDKPVAPVASATESAKNDKTDATPADAASASTTAAGTDTSESPTTASAATGASSAAEASEPSLKMIPKAKAAATAKKDKGHAATTVVAGPDHATPHFKTHAGVDPEKALGWMKHGNARFVKGNFRRDGASKKDIARLVKGQKPHTIVLSCSDSRLPPEVVFDQKLGEIFTIRTAGEALDDNVVASVEYAIEHLGTRLVLVLGHTSCAAVKAAVGTLKGGDTGTPALNALVADLHPRLQAFVDKQPSADLSAESLANAEGIVGDLVKRSALIREAYDGGDVEIRAALYHLDSGVVTIQ